MGRKLDDQKGITLLEVLLSIVLLVIVLTSFASFFTQSALFVKKNEDKISTTQTAQQIVNLIEVKLTRDILSTSTECPSLPCNLDEDKLSGLLGRSFGSSQKIFAEFSKGAEELITVEVSVQDTNNPESNTRTFTYIRR